MIRRINEKRLLVACVPSPFVVARSRHQRSSLFESRTEHRLFLDRLHARIDGVGSDLEILGPSRHQAPP